jgi:hypothetical protein
VRLSRRATAVRPVLCLAAAAAFSLPATSATAVPTHPPDPASVARAIAENRPASIERDPGAAARPGPVAVAPYYATLGDEHTIDSTAAGPAVASSDPDGPTWAAALVAGALAALAAAGLGVIAGRRSARMPNR